MNENVYPKKVEILNEDKKEMEIKFHEKIEKEKTLAKWVKNQVIMNYKEKKLN